MQIQAKTLGKIDLGQDIHSVNHKNELAADVASSDKILIQRYKKIVSFF